MLLERSVGLVEARGTGQETAGTAHAGFLVSLGFFELDLRNGGQAYQ